MNLQKAYLILKQNNIEYEIEYGFSVFHYTAITFDNKKTAIKAIKLLFPKLPTLTKCNSGRYGVEFF
jgi:hypothetical protein